MCGIWSLLSKTSLLNQNLTPYHNSFMKIQNRGPDNSVFKLIDNNIILGFHRLAMIDVSDNGNQPFELKNDTKLLYSICNGEIYNYKELINQYNLSTTSGSDCEVILHLYNIFGIEQMIKLFKGVFSIIIYEYDFINHVQTVHVIDDRIGVRPLFYSQSDNQIGLSSEIKGLSDIFDKVHRFPPGHYATINSDHQIKFTQYYNYVYNQVDYTIDQVYQNIRNTFYDAIKKRIQSDRPVCALLSGGLDSSIVAAIANQIIKNENPQNTLKTFTIGLEGGTDIEYAEMVAKHIGSDHTTIIVTEQDFINSIDNVIYSIESYDTTTVRASVGQFKISEFIANNTDYKCILCGDGSDELLGGYLYFHNCPSPLDFHNECVRLIKDIHIYDSLRADRAVAHHGLELRVPFLDQDFVNCIMSINPEIRKPLSNQMEKIMFRKAFENTNLLPTQILMRRKEAFSDGVSSKSKSWYQILQDNINKMITDDDFNKSVLQYEINKPKTKESLYYRRIFNKYFGNNDQVIPYMWMPKWCGDINDPSARVLQHYNC
jgi:asparagine synthase (glutamine-hydrolysing)